MVDGVQFNPFTGKAFSAEEIGKLDTNNDGIISEQEFETNLSWVSRDSDAEGDVEIGGSELPERTGKILNAAKQNGVKDIASNSDELQENMVLIQDQYIEQFISENPSINDKDLATMIAFIKTSTTSFVSEFLQKSPKAPFNISDITSQYVDKMDQLTAKYTKEIGDINANIDELKDPSNSFDKLSELASNAGKYVGKAEYEAMKKQAIEYIMGQLLNGTEDTEFMNGISSNYKNNSNYIGAMNAVKSMQGTSDPAKIQEFLNKAMQCLDKFFGEQNVDGSSKLQNAVNTKTKAAEEAKRKEDMAKHKAELSDINDKMVEDFSNTPISKKLFGFINIKKEQSQENVEAFAQTMSKILDAFLAQYKGDGTDIQKEYQDFVAKKLDEMQKAMDEVESMPSSEKNFKSLQDAVKSAGTNADKTETADINKKAADFVLGELFRGQAEIAVLADAYPGYAKDPLFMEAKKLVEGFNSSITRKEDLAKIKDLLTQLMAKVGVKALSAGVKAEDSKNAKLSNDASITAYLHGYNTNDTVGGDDENFMNFTVNKEGKVEWTNGDDGVDNQKTIDQLSQRIHEKMKDQLGDKYKKADIDKYINQAVLEAAMGLSNPSGLHKMSELVDSILQKFDKIATDGLHGKSATSDPNKIDRAGVLQGADAFDDYSSGVQTGAYSRKGADATASAKEKAKQKLETLRASLINQLKSKLGDKFDSTAINRLVDEAINTTIDSFPFYDTKGSNTGYRIGFNMSELYNNLFNNFDSAYQQYAEKLGLNK